MSDPIGIVAGSAPGAALCYETICTEAPELLGRHEHPEISLHGHSFGHYVRLMEQGDWPSIGKLLVDSTKRVASVGAKFAICPDNTFHQALPAIEHQLPIPWLHIAEVVAREAAHTGAGRLAILGTRWLMEGPVYAETLAAAGIEWRIPNERDRERINDIIFGDLVFHRVTEKARNELAHVISDLARGDLCDAVVLGCTELPLAVTDEVSPIPTLDSTRLLARAAIRRAARGDSS